MNTSSLIAPDIDSTLDDLPSINSSVQFDILGDKILQFFNQNPGNPGVIIMKQQEILGVLSREIFFENTGRRFGVEVFLNRPIYLMLEKFSTHPLILPSSSKISFA
ncbi:MAG TPA: hypothetical protein VF338_06460, partial [Leptolinea sp.]